jgi:thiol-disulfide isomerase/thioredoxin
MEIIKRDVLIIAIIIIMFYIYNSYYNSSECIQRSKNYKIYYFYSPTCPYCTDVTPIFDHISKEILSKNGVKIVYRKINMSDKSSTKNTDLIKKFKVSGMPTLIKTDVNGNISHFKSERTYANIKGWVLHD